MIRFLRLFAAFRDLEGSCRIIEQSMEDVRQRNDQLESDHSDLIAARDEVQRLSAENDKLQDRLDAAMEDRKQLWEMVQQSSRELSISYQASLNLQWQQRGFGSPYPEAPHLPPNAVPKPNEKGSIARREIPSEQMARATRKFAEDIVSRMKQ